MKFRDFDPELKYPKCTPIFLLCSGWKKERIGLENGHEMSKIGKKKALETTAPWRRWGACMIRAILTRLWHTRVSCTRQGQKKICPACLERFDPLIPYIFAQMLTNRPVAYASFIIPLQLHMSPFNLIGSVRPKAKNWPGSDSNPKSDLFYTFN